MQIKRKLTDREQKLLQILANEKEKAIKEIARLFNKDVSDIRTTITDMAVDDADLSFLDENKSTDWALAKTYNERVKNIEDAMLRLTRGEYGSCQRCGHFIPEKRLEALPFVRYCIDCQKEMEKMES
ncbi:MAG: TraR/DksA C4-type zinc finger protein [bacterium]